MHIDSNGVVWILGEITGYSNVLVRMEKTGGGAYNDPTQWQLNHILSYDASIPNINNEAAVFGDVDGSSELVQTRRIATFAIGGYDGVWGATSGTNPMFLLPNVANDSIKELTLDAGGSQTTASDWTLTTPSYYGGLNNTTSFDTYGVAPNQFNGSIALAVGLDGAKLWQLGWNSPQVSNTFRPITEVYDYGRAGQNREVVFGKGNTGYANQSCY
jgi:hypothetical protein